MGMSSAASLVSSTVPGYQSQSAMPSSSLRASSAAPAASPTAITKDGNCGGSTGLTCLGNMVPGSGQCCSQYGFWYVSVAHSCHPPADTTAKSGSGPQYCMAGCQPGFGICGNGAGNTTMSIASFMSTSVGSTSFPTMTATNMTSWNGTSPVATDTVTDCGCTGSSMKAPTSSIYSTKTANIPSPYTGAAVPLPREQMGMVAAGFIGAVGVGLLQM